MSIKNEKVVRVHKVKCLVGGGILNSGEGTFGPLAGNEA